MSDLLTYRPRADVAPVSADEKWSDPADRFGPDLPKGSPIVTVWSYWHPFVDGSFDRDPDRVCFSGLSGGNPVPAWVSEVSRVGHAITVIGRDGRGHRYFSHDDARFCEARPEATEDGSQAAYYESGDAWGRAWWDDEMLAGWLLADARTGSGPTARFETWSDR